MKKPYVVTVTLKIPMHAKDTDECDDILEDEYPEVIDLISDYNGEYEVKLDDMEEEQ